MIGKDRRARPWPSPKFTLMLPLTSLSPSFFTVVSLVDDVDVIVVVVDNARQR